MSVPRRVSGMAVFMAINVAVIGGAVAVAVFRPCGPNPRAARSPGHVAQTGPKAVVDKTPWDLGVIESGAALGHTFVIRNDGSAPLQLVRGRKLCACTVTDLPDDPIPPGGQAKVTMGFTEAARHDTLKPGPFSRGVRVLTNDPDNADILLELNATVIRRLSAAPSPVTLAIDSSKLSSPEQRSVEACLYSERWERFELSVAKTSRKNVQWHIEPAANEQLKDLRARSGYRVLVTLPPDMADGPFAEWIEFSGKPIAANAGEKGPNSSPDSSQNAASCRLDIQGRVDGRLMFYGSKVVQGNGLRLGAIVQGQPVRETFFMKINDECRRLAVESIQTEPKFLHARLTSYTAGSKDIGLYRITVEIPADAPSCAFTGEHPGIVRLKTDHPRLPLIELKVDFALVGHRG